MTPRVRDDEEEEAFILRFISRLEESWMRVRMDQIEKKADGQHERHGKDIASLKYRQDGIVLDLQNRYMTIDKFNDAIRLQDEKNRRSEDREKWIMLGMKWAAFGGGVGAAIEIVLKAAGK